MGRVLKNEKISNKVVDVRRPEPGDQVVTRPGGVNSVSAEGHVAKGRQHCARGDPIQRGLRSPIARPPLAIRYWFITAVSPAQIGADCEVPPPTNCCCLNTIRTPVNGSATAATSGVKRFSVS